MNSQDTEQLIDGLFLKAIAKKIVFKKTLISFNEIKSQLRIYERWMQGRFNRYDQIIDIEYQEHGDFEAEMKFGIDTLVFLMHTDVFTFPEDHFIHKTNYVKDDPLRAYTGMIMIYDFLTDSIKYNRIDDLGTLVGRIFINKEGHFFIHGQKQYSYLFRDFANSEIDKKNIKLIIETSIKQAIDFDMYAPPIDAFNQITLLQKIQATDHFALRTGKRLGFDVDIYDDDKD
jgi:hypothetical protein